MDVGAPSNFERLRALYANDAALRADLSAERVDDDQIRDAISTSRARYGVVVCPHTACALVALERRRAAGDARDYAVVATARAEERRVGKEGVSKCRSQWSPYH